MQNQNVKTGLEVLLDSRLDLLDGQRVGLICHPASINSRYEHAADLLSAHPRVRLTALFGPQHGIRGETQDNMIEWQTFRDSRTGLPAYSLYGETRKPTPEMLNDVDVLVFDVQDVGTRVYTFVYTMALAMQAARECGKRFVVLDRPNPINGAQVEGNLLDPSFASFVGMYPLPMRHGLTVAELALMFNQEFGIACDLEVVAMHGWRRAMWFEETALPWVMPSPNIPTPDTAALYPGMVMFEGTKVSEGRGTTRPFEIIGAPYVEPRRLVERLHQEALPGCVLRPMHFEPTFHKFKGQLCGGLQVHVTDRAAFKPVLTAISIIAAIRELYADRFEWTSPPYEYVHDRPPFDVINGGPGIREMIEAGRSPGDIEASWRGALDDFAARRRPFLLYE